MKPNPVQVVPSGTELGSRRMTFVGCWQKCNHAVSGTNQEVHLSHRVLAPGGHFTLEEQEVECAGVKPVCNRVTASAADIRPALALPRDDVAVLIGRAAYVTLAGHAAVGVVKRQPVVVLHALVAVSSHDEALASALAGLLVAPIIRNDAEQVAHAF